MDRARADKHLTGLAEWNAPSAGMFLWLRLLAGVTDADQIFELLKDARVVVVPGVCFIGGLQASHVGCRPWPDVVLFGGTCGVVCSGRPCMLFASSC